ncbi:hypothetical protein CRYPA_573 [uncultured Candidatus Thioglobus sp.]|nr:hypothetical protein CRYPA_573 [uncultured Candidatus Thioglobus sp.]
MTIEKKHVIQAIHIMKQLQAKVPVTIHTSSDGCGGGCGGRSKK